MNSTLKFKSKVMELKRDSRMGIVTRQRIRAYKGLEKGSVILKRYW